MTQSLAKPWERHQQAEGPWTGYQDEELGSKPVAKRTPVKGRRITESEALSMVNTSLIDTLEPIPRGIGDTLKRIGPSLANALTHFELPPSIFTRGGFGEAGKEFQKSLKALDQATTTSEAIAIRSQAQQELQETLDKRGVRKFVKGLQIEQEPPVTVGEKVVDVGTGLIGFLARLMIIRGTVAKRLVPKAVQTEVAFELENTISGGPPGMGVAMATGLKGIQALPIHTGLKLGAESTGFASLAAISGEDEVGIYINALIPSAFRAGRGVKKLATAMRGAKTPEQLYKAMSDIKDHADELRKKHGEPEPTLEEMMKEAGGDKGAEVLESVSRIREATPQETKPEKIRTEPKVVKVTKIEPEPSVPRQSIEQVGGAKVQAIDRKTSKLIDIELKPEQITKSLRGERMTQSWLQRLLDCLRGVTT